MIDGGLYWRCFDLSEPVYEVVVEKNIFIPLPGGVRLAADLYRPRGEGRFPALVTMTPYHKDDFLKIQFEGAFRYFAERGYVQVVVDVRGTGSSGGETIQALSYQEQRDGYDVVEWIAGQPWCDGRVGMWGHSYGGALTLLVAATNPPHLKAITPIHAPVDWYLDWNYPGGRLNALQAMGNYGPLMLVMNSMPSSYRDLEGNWSRALNTHLQGNLPWLFPVWQNRVDGPFYRTSSVDLKRIKVPTMLIGGWRDLFSRATVKAYQEIEAPKRWIMGPWMHEQPSMSQRAKIHYLHEMLGWWDHWLKRIDTGVLDEPPIALYIQGADEWRYERRWPPEAIQKTPYYLHHQGLSPEPPGEEEAERYDYNPTVGVMAGLWDPNAFGPALDQRPDEALSLTYTSEPLKDDLEVTGSPLLILFASSTAEDTTFVAKLSDVSQDGFSRLVTTGWLNATHRRSHGDAEPLKPGEIYELQIELWPTSYLFKVGHRIRLAISSSDFPRIWPTSEKAVNTIYHDREHLSRLILPTILGGEKSLPKPSFHPPPPHLVPSIPLKPRWIIERDMVAERVALKAGFDIDFKANSDVEIHLSHNYEATTSARDPSDTMVKAKSTLLIPSKTQTIRLEALSKVTLNHVTMTINILVDGLPCFIRSFAT